MRCNRLTENNIQLDLFKMIHYVFPHVFDPGGNFNTMR